MQIQSFKIVKIACKFKVLKLLFAVLNNAYFMLSMPYEGGREEKDCSIYSCQSGKFLVGGGGGGGGRGGDRIRKWKSKRE